MKIKKFFYQNDQRKKLYKNRYKRKFLEYSCYSFMCKNKKVQAFFGPHCRVKRAEIALSAKDLRRSDHPTSFNGKNFKRLKNATVNRIGVSQRKRFDVTQSTIHCRLKKVGLKYYECQKAVKYN